MWAATEFRQGLSGFHKRNHHGLIKASELIYQQMGRSFSGAFHQHHQPTPNPPLICGIKCYDTSNHSLIKNLRDPSRASLRPDLRNLRELLFLLFLRQSA
ncbi:MAG TPA: hypothetical protein VF646_17280 [Cytophagales bacterium]